jgi:hypothetical protein
VTGLLALFLDRRAGAPVESAPWGISPRGWVSRILLTLTAVTLGAQDLRLLGFWGEPKDAGATRAGAGPQEPARPVLDLPSAFSQRELPANLRETTGETPKEKQLREEKEAFRRKAEQLEAAQPGKGGPELSSLEKRLSDLEKGLADLQTAVKGLPALEKKLSTLTSDLSTLKDAAKPGRPGSQ